MRSHSAFSVPEVRRYVPMNSNRAQRSGALEDARSRARAGRVLSCLQSPGKASPDTGMDAHHCSAGRGPCKAGLRLESDVTVFKQSSSTLVTTF